MPSEFHDRTNPPLSPPASDGLMSPMSHTHDFQDKIPMDPNLPTMWMSNAFGMKADSDDMSLPMQDHSVTASPPPLFIEDILRAQDNHSMQGMGNGFMDEHDFQEHGLSGPSPMKRPRDELSSVVGFGGQFHSGAAGTSGVSRVRKKRHLTEPSEANFHCTKCGKYFSRIWNYNAHLETHNPHRPRPHVCPVDDCKKAFVRRTDLTRHQQCVHAKDKKFRCELCNNMFARKDTLRRHEDDGCPKRVDIASRGSKNKPIVWNSQALGFYSAMQRRDEVLPNMTAYDPQMRPNHYDNGMSSHLPPLSDIVPKTPSSVLWG
ncbi:unnamed protein product [Tuber melanosporum]|uniref:C2H2 type master regulator of conidiophore development brlA n=1 Tax=Tuber melanosporum (strain Mel28) TaxID=656061 RepID=D5GMH4_TUBMM|nr:uncharacterized protein GSTUM_00010730001 [Tuber melanosporum]CAZ85717.1 unnamed protein product [Tuber melanosporum]